MPKKLLKPRTKGGSGLDRLKAQGKKGGMAASRRGPVRLLNGLGSRQEEGNKPLKVRIHECVSVSKVIMSFFFQFDPGCLQQLSQLQLGRKCKLCTVACATLHYYTVEPPTVCLHCWETDVQWNLQIRQFVLCWEPQGCPINWGCHKCPSFIWRLLLLAVPLYLASYVVPRLECAEPAHAFNWSLGTYCICLLYFLSVDGIIM